LRGDEDLLNGIYLIKEDKILLMETKAENNVPAAAVAGNSVVDRPIVVKPLVTPKNHGDENSIYDSSVATETPIDTKPIDGLRNPFSEYPISLPAGGGR